MKLITAIVTPVNVGDLKAALQTAGATGMTLSEARGCGHQGVWNESDGGTDDDLDLVPGVRLEVACDDDAAERLVAAIATAVGAGGNGGGAIWVTSIERAIRVRTAEEDADAL